jgi:hypothetical protein
MRLPVGASVQDAVGGIDLKAEEKRIGKTIHLNNVLTNEYFENADYDDRKQEEI